MCFAESYPFTINQRNSFLPHVSSLLVVCKTLLKLKRYVKAVCLSYLRGLVSCLSDYEEGRVMPHLRSAGTASCLAVMLQAHHRHLGVEASTVGAEALANICGTEDFVTYRVRTQGGTWGYRVLFCWAAILSGGGVNPFDKRKNSWEQGMCWLCGWEVCKKSDGLAVYSQS